MGNYPDPVQALIDWLVLTLPAGPGELIRRIVPEFPPDLMRPGNAGSVPCAVIERIGGHDPSLGVDVVRVNVDLYTFGPDPMQARAAALARAEDIRRAIRIQLPGKRAGGVWVNKTITETGPTIRPYDSRHQVKRAQAAFTLTLHSPL